MKYKLQIIREEDEKVDTRDHFMQKVHEYVIFQANVSPDGTIELLQHLWELVDRESCKDKD